MPLGLTPPPTAPSLSDPGTFPSRSDAFVAWFSTFITEWSNLSAAEFFNVLGTVSMSGGNPNGALFEQGANANGNYVRFADGTQICWNNNFSTVSAAAATWTFPATFNVSSYAPAITAMSRFATDARIIAALIDGGGSISCSVHSWSEAGADTVSPDVSIMAIGLWA
ncbi:hypothetical protein QEZ52_00240 [Aliisedimentitalea scapharcae]|uniref:H-type lectin domain-containing protein n=1 Tax=Aliisedimentitalea scapharcae TaxID=1524259 RepID=A0ABZ2XUM4_9RHOB